MSPKIELLNVDCLEYMKTVPDKYFELAIVDPPYGIGADKKNAHRSIRDNDKWRKTNWDNSTPNEGYFKELMRVSKNQIIWGGNYFIDFLQSTSCFIVWDKGVREFSLADAELAWTSFPTSVRIKTIHRAQLILEGDKIHPTQKPVKLYKWLLQNYATCNKCNNTGSMYEDVVGDGGSQMLIDCEWCEVAERGRPKILDTHGGSMSIAIACHQMGFDLTLCEIDKDYYDAGVKRYKEQTKQLDMFNQGTKVA